ncbi:MAG: hypothetical protein ABR552_02515, partial [Actinomycetota bacterium]
MPRRALAVALAALFIPTACRSTPASQPFAGGTLSVAVRDLGSLDPAKETGAGAQEVIAQLFMPLTSVEPSTNRLRPGAAKTWSI